MTYMLPSTQMTVSATQMTTISMLINSGRTHLCRRFAYPLARIHARLEEVCDWLHLHTTGLSPATFRQLAWRTIKLIPVRRAAALPVILAPSAYVRTRNLTVRF